LHAGDLPEGQFPFMGVDAVPAQLAFQPIVDVPGITRAVIWAMADGGLVEWERL